MKPSKQQKRTRMTRLLMKIVLVIVSTAVVVYFMPRGDEFGYKYELNKPWNYGLLIANTKFPILKNDSAIHKERETTLRAFQPYYSYDRTVRDSMVSHLRRSVALEWQGQNADMYLQHIHVLLDTIYRHGVLSADDYTRLKEKEHRANIRVVHGNLATPTPLKSVFSPRTAYDYIMSADTSMYSELYWVEHSPRPFMPRENS